MEERREVIRGLGDEGKCHVTVNAAAAELVVVDCGGDRSSLLLGHMTVTIQGLAGGRGASCHQLLFSKVWGGGYVVVGLISGVSDKGRQQERSGGVFLRATTFVTWYSSVCFSSQELPSRIHGVDMCVLILLECLRWLQDCFEL